MAGVTFQGTPFADAPRDPSQGDTSLGGFGRALWQDMQNSYGATAQGVQDLGMGAMGYKVPLSDNSDPLTLATGGHITPAGENIIMAMGGRALATEPRPNELGIFGGSGARAAPSDPEKWFRGADGQPRFEINDAQAKMKAGDIPDMTMAPRTLAKSTTVGGAFNHPELFKQYPELADKKLSLERMNPDELGYNFPDNLVLNAVRQNEDGSLRPATKSELTPIILHELQHEVQNKEGFAPGSNPAEAQATLRSLAEQSRQKAWAARSSGDVQGYVGHVTDMNRFNQMAQYPYGSYHNLAGEVESRNVEDRYKIQQELGLPQSLSDLGITAQRTEDVPRSRQFIFPVSHDPFSPPSLSNPHPVEHDPFVK